MATPTYYVSSSGSNTSPYDTWAKAANAFATIDALTPVGVLIWIDSTHSESGTTVAGTANASAQEDPNLVVSVNSSTDVYEPGAKFTSTGALTIGTTNDAGTIFFGITFEASTSSAADLSKSADTHCDFVDCTFELGAGSSGASDIRLNADTHSFYPHKNTDLVFGATNTDCELPLANTQGLTISGSAITDFLNGAFNTWDGYYDGLDLSAGAASMDYLTNATTANSGPFHNILSNSKVPATFDYPGAAFNDLGTQFQAYNITDGTGHLHGVLIAGRDWTVNDNTSTYLDADVDGTSFSLELTTLSTLVEWVAAEFEVVTLWLDANATIQINFTANVTLDKGNAWLEIGHPTSGNPQLRTWITTRDSSDFAGGTSAALSTNTPGWTSPSTNQYLISHTVTGGVAGPHTIKFCTNVPSATIFIDPEPDIS